MNPAIFLDRDNTLIKDNNGYLHKKENLEFLPWAIEGLKSLKERYKLIIITNQSGIGRGYFREEEYLSFREEMNRKLRLEGISISGEYYCPHHPKTECRCRKPNTALFEQAIREHDIDISLSWTIGDKPSDILAGTRIKTRNLGIKGPESDEIELFNSGAERIFYNLNQAREYIIHNTLPKSFLTHTF